MADVKISQLPAGTAAANAVVPATNAAGTTTEKITLGAIAALGGGPPASHAHGNVTNDGKIGTTSGLPVVTGSAGVLQAGSFGTGSGTVCQGNDARLSDSRTPTAHANTHQTGQADAISPVIVTPSALAASQNNSAPGACDILRLSSSTAIDITGLVAGTVDGVLLLLINTNASGGSAITLKHESASSTAANRFRSATGADIILLADGGAVTLTYSTAISRWRIL